MIIQRLKEYIDAKGISISAFEKSIGMSNASFGKALKNNGAIGSDKLENILSVYSDINPEWLLTGHGPMLLTPQTSGDNKPNASLIHPSISSTEESIIYKMYEKKDEENKSLIEELGGLKERIRTLEATIQEYKSSSTSPQKNSKGLKPAKNVSIEKPSSPNADNATSVIAR